MAVPTTRAPIIGVDPESGERVRRTKVIQIFCTPAEIKLFDQIVKQRRCRSRGDLVRLYLEQDMENNLLFMDDAIRSVVQLLGIGFGSAVGSLAAQAEVFTLEHIMGGGSR